MVDIFHMAALDVMETSVRAYVRARLADIDRSLVWRAIEADDLEHAIKIVEQQDDVEVVLEASTEPGGVVT
jgi:hypothetical protein